MRIFAVTQLCGKCDRAELCCQCHTQKLKLSVGLAVCGRKAGTADYQEPPNARPKSYGEVPAERTVS